MEDRKTNFLVTLVFDGNQPIGKQVDTEYSFKNEIIKNLQHLVKGREIKHFVVADDEVINDKLKGEPKTEWIPVSERLPDAQEDGDKDFSDWVQVTINLGKDNLPCVSEAYYCFSTNKWYIESVGVIIGEVVAWQPLPEPYK